MAVRCKGVRMLAAAVILAGFAACSSRPPAPAPSPPGEPSPAATALASVTATAEAGTTPAASASLAPANEALREGRFGDAAGAFAAAAQAATDPSQRAEALIGAAIARYGDGDLPGAIASLLSAHEAAPAGSAVKRNAAFLLGMRLNEAGRPAEALPVLSPYAEVPASDVLQPYILLEFGRAAALTGQPTTAQRAWERALASPALPAATRAEVYRAAAGAARATGELPALASALRQLADVSGDAAPRYELASLQQQLGDTAGQAESLRRVVAEHPGSREAVLAIADLKDAGVSIDAGQEGLVYYRRGAYREARLLLSAAVDEAGISPSQRASRTYYLGATYEDSGNTAAAIESYDAVSRIDPGGSYVHRARYWAAHATEASGDAQKASDRYLALATAGPAGEFSAEAAFRTGYVLLRAGNATAALAAWERAGAAADARLAYWQGRAFETTGAKDRAAEAYARAATDPLSMYAAEARRRAGLEGPRDTGYRPLPPIPPIDWDGLRSWLTRLAGPPPRAPAATGAAELVALGLRGQARDLVLRAAEGDSPWQLLEMSREAHAAGLAEVSAQLAVRLRQVVRSEYSEAPVDLLRLAYPIAYSAALDREAKANGVDPLFLAALVRQESFWDPTAVSPADAYGLTQVIPPTGESIARALGVSPFRTSDLLKPSVSLRFGAYYLAGQMKRFGAAHIALAAYNAGPGNAARWAEGDVADAAEFAARIDYLETQRYVVLVLEHYAHYRLAYGPHGSR